MRKHIGSTVAIIVGALSILAGVTKTPGLIITGAIIILGALAYRSAKKRKIGEVPNNLGRAIAELVAIISSMALIALQNNFAARIESDPVPNLIIPLWVLIAYTFVMLRRRNGAVGEKA